MKTRKDLGSSPGNSPAQRGASADAGHADELGEIPDLALPAAQPRRSAPAPAGYNQSSRQPVSRNPQLDALLALGGAMAELPSSPGLDLEIDEAGLADLGRSSQHPPSVAPASLRAPREGRVSERVSRPPPGPDAARSPVAHRAEAARADSGRADSGRPESRRADSGRPESRRAEAARADSGRSSDFEWTAPKIPRLAAPPADLASAPEFGFELDLVAPSPGQEDPGASSSAPPSVSPRATAAYGRQDSSFPPPRSVSQSYHSLSRSSSPPAAGEGASRSITSTPPSQLPESDPWPRGELPEAELLAPAVDAVELCAAFGPVPTGLLASLPYAWRVFWRRRELSRKLQELEPLAQEALRLRDAVLVELFSSARAEAVVCGRLGAEFEELEQREQRVLRLEQDLRGLDEAGARQLEELERELNRAQQELTRKSELLQKAEQEAASAERKLRREEAQRRRIEIEMRNLVERARRQDPEATHLPPELVPRYRVLESELESSTRLIEAANALYQARTKEQERFGLDLGEASARHQNAEGQREARKETLRQKQGQIIAELEQAQAQVAEQQAAMARRLLSYKGDVPLSLELRRRLASRESSAEKLCRELSLWKVSLDSAEPSVLLKARLLTIGLVVALLLMWWLLA